MTYFPIYYCRYEGNAVPGAGAGAYMFRPANCNKDASNISCVGNCHAQWSVRNGTLVSEVSQTFAEWARQVRVGQRQIGDMSENIYKM